MLRNAPPNLRTAIATRADPHLGIDDLVAYGQCAVLTQETLRFQFDETLEAVGKRFGNQIDADGAARLHELTDGWPLGLQLVLSTIAGGSDVRLAALHRWRMAKRCASISSACSSPTWIRPTSNSSVASPFWTTCTPICATSWRHPAAPPRA